MSIFQVLRTVEDILQDPARGVETRARAIAQAEGLPLSLIPGNIIYGRWEMAEQLKRANDGRLVVRPAVWNAQAATVADGGVRDSRYNIEILYDAPTGRDLDLLQFHVTLMATAVVACVSELPEFSHETGGGIFEVFDPIAVTFGKFSPSRVVTAGGFSCTFNCQEQSAL